MGILAAETTCISLSSYLHKSQGLSFSSFLFWFARCRFNIRSLGCELCILDDGSGGYIAFTLLFARHYMEGVLGTKRFVDFSFYIECIWYCEEQAVRKEMSACG